jgi:murein L,D-transpeptidase YafK
MNNRLTLKLFAAFLLLSCVSSAPEPVTGKRTSLHPLLSSIAGDLQLVIWKSRYTVALFKGGTRVKTYQAVFGKGYYDGDKQMIGDKRTPEGEFYICAMNESKRFHKFMGISYPSMKHAKTGLRSKMISLDEYTMIKQAIESRTQPPWETRLGGAIGLHGRTTISENAQPSVGNNWTDGCIALDNADVDELYRVVSLRTPVTILP